MLYTEISITRNESADFLENRNNSASVYVPPEQIREPEQIRCDTGIELYSEVNPLYWRPLPYTPFQLCSYWVHGQV